MCRGPRCELVRDDDAGLTPPKRFSFVASGFFEYFGHKHSDFPIAKENKGFILSLSLYPEISEEEIKYEANSIEVFYRT